MLATAKTHEPDRYLAALLAPMRARPGLLAVAAFAGEIAKIPHLATEPMIAEIRLQWWRDALCSGPDHDPSGHPVADAMRAATADFELSVREIMSVIESVRGTGHSDASTDIAAANDQRAAFEYGVFVLSSAILQFECAPSAHMFNIEDTSACANTFKKTCAAAARAYGMARLSYQTALARSKGQSPLSADLYHQARSELRQARRHGQTLPLALKPAFLPLALVEPYLRHGEQASQTNKVASVSLWPLTRNWSILRAHLLGRW